MASGKLLAALLCVSVLAALVADANARYLPTRANNDRLDKLRELLRDLLESEFERAEFEQEGGPPYRNGDRKLFFKRETTH